MTEEAIDSELQALVDPFLDLLIDEWETCRGPMGTDDLLIMLDTRRGEARALPRKFVLREKPDLFHPEILKRIRSTPRLLPRCTRAFWVVFNVGPEDAMACICCNLEGVQSLLLN